MSVAEQNRNPLNIKNDPRNVWRGSIGTDKAGHAVFEDARYAIRAAVRSLARKAANGKRSVFDIIDDWAPRTDTIGSIKNGLPNNPDEYAEYVASKLGVMPDDALPIFIVDGAIYDLTLLVSMLRAMCYWESGGDYSLPLSTWLEGIAMYQRDFVEGKR